MPTNTTVHPRRLARGRQLLVAGALAAAAGCDWIALARGAATYTQVGPGEAANVVAGHDRFYVTLAGGGLAVVDANSGAVSTSVPATSEDATIDDLAIDGELLFALDARPPGAVSVYSLKEPDHPRLVSGRHPVPVGPFSGVAAANGVCLVSGGTSSLTAWRYDSTGVLTGPVARADLGRGQPDVSIAADGATAFASTHYWGPYFGLTRLRLGSSGSPLHTAGTVPLKGAGFTAGGAKPGNFPIVSVPLGDGGVLVAHARGVTRIERDLHDSLARGTLTHVGGPAVSLSVRDSVAAVSVGGRAPAVVLLAFAGDSLRVVRRIALRPGTFPAGVALSASSVAVAARDQGLLVFRR